VLPEPIFEHISSIVVHTHEFGISNGTFS